MAGPDLPATSYLFGSMHVKDLRAFSQFDFIKDKLNDCSAYAAEFHLDETHPAAVQKMTLPKGVTLKSLIPEKKYTKLRKVIVKATGIDLDFFQYSSPFMLTGLIGAGLLGKDMPLSLDEHLWRYAKSCGKSMFGIETLKEQLDVLDQISTEMQLKMLLDLGRNIKRFRHYTLHTAELYQQGELQRLSKSVAKNAGKLRKIMLYHRNEIMSERIYELVKKESVFTSIGAGHLGGGKGVIRLLKQKGLTVKPIR